MKLILHIMKKDFRHTWPFLALWWLLLFCQTLLPYWVIHTLPDFGYAYSATDFLEFAHSSTIAVNGRGALLLAMTLSAPFLGAALVAVSGARVIHADEPDDPRAHWRTLPVSSFQLFAAKILFPFLFAVLAATCTSVAVRALRGLPPHEWLGDEIARASATLVLFSAGPVIMVLVRNAVLRVLLFIGLVVACVYALAGISLLFQNNGSSAARAAIPILALTSGCVIACRYLRFSRTVGSFVLLFGLSMAVCRAVTEAPWANFHSMAGSNEVSLLGQERIIPIRQAGFLPVLGFNNVVQITQERGGQAVFFGAADNLEDRKKETLLDSTAGKALAQSGFVLSLNRMPPAWLEENHGEDFPLMNWLVLGEIPQPRFLPSQEEIVVARSMMQPRWNSRPFLPAGTLNNIFGLYRISPRQEVWDFAQIAPAAGLGRSLNTDATPGHPGSFPLGGYWMPIGMTDLHPRSTLTDTATVDIIEVQRWADMPLRPGIDERGPYRTELLSIDQDPRQIVWGNSATTSSPRNFLNLNFVSMESGLLPWPGWQQPVWPKQYYVLWNPKRQESFLIEYGRLLAMNGVRVFGVNFTAKKFRATVEFQHLANGQSHPFSDEETQAWIADARLVRLAIIVKQRFRGSFTIDPFVPPEQTAAASPQPTP